MAGLANAPMKVAVFTATRAEYGLLKPMLTLLRASESFELQLIVGGTHLLEQFGSTIKQIEQDGFEVAEKVDFLTANNQAEGVVRSMGLATLRFADVLSQLAPDRMVLLGDRFEALCAAQSALIFNIPLLHIHGGEITEGAVDDAIRHSLSKIAHLHCVSTESHRQRVIQLGEQPDNVFNVGAPGVEQFLSAPDPGRQAVLTHLSLMQEQRYAVFTYHPVTQGDEPVLDSIDLLIELMAEHSELQWIITFPNADAGGQMIIERLTAAANEYSHFHLRPSIGSMYAAVIRHAACVLGNSSSGIIEVPSLNIPVINVGIRQQGRSRSNAVLDVGMNKQALKQALNFALSTEGVKQANRHPNPYQGQNSAAKIISVLSTPLDQINTTFYDLEQKIH